MQKTYHVGLLMGAGAENYWPNGYSTNTLIVQARRDKDYLSPDLWEYLGERIITKTQLKINKWKILEETNRINKTIFTNVVID